MRKKEVACGGGYPCHVPVLSGVVSTLLISPVVVSTGAIIPCLWSLVDMAQVS